MNSQRLFLAGLLWLGLALSAQAALLTGDREAVPLAGQMAVLHDPAGLLNIAEVSSTVMQNRFTPLPGNLSAGYVRGDVWLRFELVRTEDAPAEWWLEIPNPLIDEVSLFIPTEEQSPTMLYTERRAGEQVPRTQRDSIQYRQVAFRLAITTDKPQTLYLRLRSVNALVSDPALLTDNAFAAKTSRDDSIFGGLFTLLAVITLTGLMVGGSLRDKGILASAGFNISLLLILLPNEGFLQLNLLPGYPRAADIFIGLGLALNFICGWELLVNLGGLGQEAPRLAQRVRWLVGLVTIPIVLISLAGRYGQIAPLVQITGQVEGLIIVILTSVLAVKGNRNARLFFLPYVSYILLSLTRLGRNLGWLPANEFTEHGFHIAVVIQAVSMAAIASTRLRQLHSEREAAQARQLLLSQENQRELEHRVSERTADLRQAIEEQRHLLSMVSHEFRNPLAVVDGAAQNIERGIGSDTALKQIRRAVGRMSQLLVNVLAEDRLTDEARPMNRQRIDLVQLARDTLESRPPATTERITISAPNEAAHVVADAHLLGIALDNLLNNALKYAPTGPIEILIEAADLPDSDAPDRHSAWRLAVLDTGAGIPADVDVFAKYVRGNVSTSTPGAGLGLFLVARIAHLHDGEATAHNRPDGGAKVGVVLPQSA